MFLTDRRKNIRRIATMRQKYKERNHMKAHERGWEHTTHDVFTQAEVRILSVLLHNKRWELEEISQAIYQWIIYHHCDPIKQSFLNVVIFENENKNKYSNIKLLLTAII